MRAPHLLSLVLPLTLAACGVQGPVTAPGARVSLAIAPLDLTGVSNATYELRVFNGASPAELVWSATVDAAGYGDGAGSISYVGPCDADPAAVSNRVELELVSLTGDGGATIDPATYQNPAPVGSPIAQTFTCQENADVAVTFDLVVLRAAQQGFFDVAVNFDDLYCSAKVDCVADDGGPLELLHQPGGGRGPTLVVGFACTTGSTATGEATPTWLHMTNITLVCGAEAPFTTYALDPSGAPGNQGVIAPGTFQTAVYRGAEALPGVEKCYWNAALGVIPGADLADCRLQLRATASDEAFPTGATPPSTTYPVIVYDVPISAGAGAVTCTRHPLNGAPVGVATDYTDLAGEVFPHHWRCGDDVVGSTEVACEGTLGGDTASLTVTADGVVATIAGVDSAPYQLPVGRVLDGCCANPCCAD